MSTIAPHRAAELLMAESEAHLVEARQEMQAIAHEMAHVARRMNQVYRYTGMSIEKARRAQNIAAGDHEWADVALPGQTSLPIIEPAQVAA